MEFKTYFNFNDFLLNYKTDFLEWKKSFPDATDYDYKEELKQWYSRYKSYDEETGSFYLDAYLGINVMGDEYPEYNHIHLKDFFSIITLRANAFEPRPETQEDFEKRINPSLFSIGNYDKYRLDYSQYEMYKYFADITEDEWEFVFFELTFNEVKFKNFSFTLDRIFEFLESDQAVPEREKPKLRTADVNYKFALLDTMGVISWLKNNIETNNEDRAKILQEIMGGSIDTLIDYLKGKSIHKDVKQKALDFINEKRLK